MADPAFESVLVRTHQGVQFKLRRRKTPAGTWSPFWLVDFEWGGRRVRHSSGTADREKAEKVARKKIDAAMEARWQQLDDSKLRRDVALLDDVLEAYEAGIQPRTHIAARTVRGNVGMLRALVTTALGVESTRGLRSSVCTRELLQRFKEARFPKEGDVGAQERAATSINSTIAQARSVFSRAAVELYKDRGLKLPDLEGFMAVRLVKNERDVSFQPIGVDVLAQMEASARALLQPDDERVVKVGGREDRRLCAARPDIYLVWLMARYIGMRDCEIWAARWDWLEQWPDGWRMAIVKRPYFKPKYTEGRVCLAPELVALLREHGANDSLWVVPGASKTARYDAIYRDANLWVRQFLPDRVKGLHELRKQAGSEIYTRERSLSAAAEFLRNKEETCRKHYAKLLVPVRGLSMVPAAALA